MIKIYDPKGTPAVVTISAKFGDLNCGDPLPAKICSYGEYLTCSVNMLTGQICSWRKQTKPVHLSIKCSDMFSCKVYDAKGNILTEIESEYVPDFIPGEYGDYVAFTISPSGCIEEWKPNAYPKWLAENEAFNVD